MTRILLILTVAAISAFGQAKSRSVVGTVTGFRPDALEMVVKTDKGEETPVKLSPETAIQRVAPGSTDLKSAQSIAVGDINKGDRVLVSFTGEESAARRVIVMPSTDIAKRNEADKLDWQKRGVAGVVVSKKSGEIELRLRSMRGASVAKVIVTDATKFHRYAPDSVKFADAKPSSLSEVSAGDQLRARGKKNDDGLTVEAEEIVFGSFVTRAGTVVSVDPQAKRITVKETGTEKPFVIRVTADSELKAMPSFGAMGGGRGGMSGGGPMGQGGVGPGRPGGAPDFAQMIERMPTTQIDALKPGETVVVSSTKGAKRDEVTAIMLLSNAEMLLRMASAQQSGRSGGQGGMQSQGLGMGMGGMNGGLGGIELPGMLP